MSDHETVQDDIFNRVTNVNKETRVQIIRIYANYIVGMIKSGVWTLNTIKTLFLRENIILS